MAITIHIPATLRAYCQNARSELVLSAETVRDAFEQLERDQPSLYKSVCDETGAIRQHVNVFVNVSVVRGDDGFDTPLSNGDILSIMPAVSGG